ncbi:MAG TPA: FAD-dependent oxidoreductase [Candidatus Dormibacteraeota bacterium]|nr:FAD-dependent oxidoreductase [Candidatus Dormibacteraeota bacterium]
MAFEHLFTPLRIGPREARNRIVFGAHFTMFSEPNPVCGEPGYFGARLGRYLADRARGGVGVVIAGQAQVHPTTAYQMPNNACAWRPEAVPHFRAVTDAVHGHGALAFLQLAHNGGVNQGPWSKLPAWAPSAVANSLEPPKPMEAADIAAVIAGFADSARHAAAGGFDGIELHAAHGYLLHEFLSPRSNRRDDAYGGSLENRLRLTVEVLAAVRAAVGARIAVGLRLVGDEETAGGLTAEDAAAIAARLEARGLVDFLDVSVGISGIGMVRPLYVPHAFASYAARAVKAAVARTPVFSVHRILEPGEAEAILARGDADAVTVVRALIADPEWPAKAARDATAEIRRCTGCNQGCYGNLTLGLPITCVTNPAVGRDAELGLGTLTPAPAPRRVVVIGGGPAGLEAAWVAAARGHRVILLERGGELGGKIRLAQQLPGRGELADFADWRIGECARRGVEVRLHHAATVESVVALAPEAVIVATGARATIDAPAKAWPLMPIPGAALPFVLDHEVALAQADQLGARVVIFDVVGHIEAIGLGELLAQRGCEAIVATPFATPMLLDRETAGYALPRAARAGMRWRPNTGLVAVGDRAVTLLDVFSRRTEVVEGVDRVVIRTHGVADDALYHALLGRLPTVLRVGDAVAARWADRAIFDGHLAGRAV